MIPQTVRFGVLSGKRERAGLDGWHADLSWEPDERVECGSELGASGLDGWMGGARIRAGGRGPDGWHEDWSGGLRGSTRIKAERPTQLDGWHADRS